MLRPPRIALFSLLLLLLPRLLAAQFSGTYTVGSGGDFATLTAALTALRNASSPQLAGPVTLLLNDGAHTPPTGGFVIPELTGAGPAATLTIRPAPGANVLIRSGTTPALIDLNGADYVVVDGHDSLGGGVIMVACSASSGSAIRFVNGASHNVVRNCTLVGNGSTNTFGVVRFDGTNNGIGNTDNVVTDNVIGDTSGTLRANSGVTMIGTSTAPNMRNRVIGNEIVNPGRGSGVAYGLYMGSNNADVVFADNEIHCTRLTGTENLHPLYGIYVTDGANHNDTIARNRIHSLDVLNPVASRYGVYISTQGTSPVHLISNMISLSSDSGLLCGIYTTEPDSIYMIGNSIYLGGPIATGAQTLGIASTTKGRLWIHDNIVVVERTGLSRGTSACLSTSTTPFAATIDRNVYVNPSDSGLLVIQGLSRYNNVLTWSAASGFDIHSITGPVPFLDPSIGDLHVDPVPLFCGEGMGTPSNAEPDIDYETRDDANPDIGADEGDFNGGRLRLLAPLDSVVVAAGTELTLTLAATRFVEGAVELLTSDGARAELGRFSLDTTATTVRSRIREELHGEFLLRIVNPRNLNEADSSNAPVIVVDPTLTIEDVGGGDEIVEGDTLQMRWSVVDCPPSITLDLELTTDDGASWRMLDTAIHSDRTDGTLETAWIVPAASAGTCRLRISVHDGPQADTSGPFVVLVEPTIDVDLPPAVPNDTLLIVRWNAVGCGWVRVLISLDGGESWMPLIPGNPRIPAWIGRAAGRIPITDSTQLLVRVVDADRPHIGRERSIRIRHPWLVCRAPFGGERKRIGEPIDIVWNGRDIERLRVEYSDDDGATWTRVVEGVTGTSGWRQYTPERRPTGRGRIRLTDMDNPEHRVMSGRFAILPASTIIPLSPTTGERIERSSQTEISWISDGVQRVSLYYTTNNGATWTLIALDIPADRGSFAWTVPSRATDAIRIRIRESGSLNYAETGTFGVIDPIPPTQSLTLLAPTSATTLTAGDEETIRWRGVGFRGGVLLEYSLDSGSAWNRIGTAWVGVGRYRWSVPFDTTSKLLIRVSSLDLDVRGVSTVPLRILPPNSSPRRENGSGSVCTEGWSRRARTEGGVDLEISGAAQVIPNPVVGRGVIRWSGSESGAGVGELYDMNGICRESFKIEETSWRRGEVELDMSNLPPGFYAIVMRSANEVVRTTILHAER